MITVIFSLDEKVMQHAVFKYFQETVLPLFVTTNKYGFSYPQSPEKAFLHISKIFLFDFFCQIVGMVCLFTEGTLVIITNAIMKSAKSTFATFYSGIQREGTIREIVTVPKQTHLKMLYLDFCSQDHIEQCSKFPVSCPNSCGVSIPREMVRLSIWPFLLTSLYCVSILAYRSFRPAG